MASLKTIMSSRVMRVAMSSRLFLFFMSVTLSDPELPRPDITGITPRFLTALCLETEDVLCLS